MHADWQTLLTLAIGLAAALYLLRRWWPRKAAASGAGCGGGTGTPSAEGQAAACGSGCGQCGGGSATPMKDHRVMIVPRVPH